MSSDPDARVEVSLILRPRRPLAELETRLGQPMTREELAASYGADPSDIARVEAFAREHNLEVVEASVPRRTLQLGGRVADLEGAFGGKLPAELADVVQGVFGLDTQPIARHYEQR